ncbi:KH domain-containing protein [Candidatus Woesearchaeota archaeon]|nr:KH domain-containing protein [Candidatus Woesearchaeota archaeon]
MEYSYELKVPKERIAVLIGKKGEIKKELEERTNTKIIVDSKEGDIQISGDDALGLYSAREVVMAVGRGFNPETAMLLLKADYVLEILNIKEFCKTKNSELRLKGRVIGKEGKSRRTIEDLTETYITVYGKTIAIIGEANNVLNSKKAIETLLKGGTHASVYRWLERKRREQKKRSTSFQ